jgi:hypothetical protein
MAYDSKGNYYVAHGDGAGAANQIWVFDSTGAFLETIGQRGEGPGEYRGIGRIDVLPGDTLQIYDRILRRRTTLAPDQSSMDTQPLEVGGFFHSVILPDGRMVVTEHRRSPERVGYPLQLVTRSGRVVRSLGTTKPDLRPGEERKLRKKVAPGPDGGSVWSVGEGDYLMELWDTTGTRRVALQRDAGWFDPLAPEAELTPRGPPPPASVRLAKTDSLGRLWVLSTTPTEGWREVVADRPDLYTNLSSLFQVYDWVLEVIDPVSGLLVASQVFFGKEFVYFLGEDMVVCYREDDEGYPHLDIYRLSLPSPPARVSLTWRVNHPGIAGDSIR